MLSALVREAGVALGRLAMREDPLVDADAVVVLGGAPRYRTPTAVDLWREGRAPCIVAVGGSDGHLEALRTVEVLARLGVPDDVVRVIEADAPGTWDEARRVAALARSLGWTTVTVVTSGYHTRRAGLLFEAALGPDVGVCIRAARDEPWRPTTWWQTPLHARLLLAEPLKYVAWRTGIRSVWMRSHRTGSGPA